jgi:hypothetical protein
MNNKESFFISVSFYFQKSKPPGLLLHGRRLFVAPFPTVCCPLSGAARSPPNTFCIGIVQLWPKIPAQSAQLQPLAPQPPPRTPLPQLFGTISMLKKFFTSRPALLRRLHSRICYNVDRRKPLHIYYLIAKNMEFQVRKDLRLSLYGVSGVAADHNWANTGMSLMNKMWGEVRLHRLKHTGINVWVYEPGDKLFTGVELLMSPPADVALEYKEVHLPEYIWYKHIGPYDKIKEVFPELKAELDQKGINHHLPYVEIYGHWTDDTSRLETELCWCI